MEYSTKSSALGVQSSKSYRSDRMKEGIEMKSKLLPKYNLGIFNKPESSPNAEAESSKFVISSIYDRKVFGQRRLNDEDN